jgi:hypothetical protein
MENTEQIVDGSTVEEIVVPVDAVTEVVEEAAAEVAPESPVAEEVIAE